MVQRGGCLAWAQRVVQCAYIVQQTKTPTTRCALSSQALPLNSVPPFSASCTLPRVYWQPKGATRLKSPMAFHQRPSRMIPTKRQPQEKGGAKRAAREAEDGTAQSHARGRGVHPPEHTAEHNAQLRVHTCARAPKRHFLVLLPFARPRVSAITEWTTHEQCPDSPLDLSFIFWRQPPTPSVL